MKSERFEELDEKLVKIVPENRQMEYQKGEFYGFVHFTVNTYTDMEWGTGKEEPEIFYPKNLDVEQWVEAAAAAGMKGLILTCKHHDGFCLWQSAYTEHCMKRSPYQDGKGDVVKELSEALKKRGMKFGVYLSPWDRNHPSYGQGKAYDDYYINQMTELLTRYGDIYTFWMDGACGEGPNGKVQLYDWDRYYAKVRELMPNAVLSISGPDVRWCGNEAGIVRQSEWSVVSKDMTNPRITAELSQKADDTLFRERPLDPTMDDLGSRERLKNERELAWYPAETDVSMRPGWFYHKKEDDKLKSLEKLKDIYLKSVGGNTVLLLNISPMPDGRLHENDVRRLQELGDFIRESFSKNLLDEAKLTSLPETDEKGDRADCLREDNYKTYFKLPDGTRSLSLHIDFQNETKLKYLVLKENIHFSQRVEKFHVFGRKEDGKREEIVSGTTIGYKKIVEMKEGRWKGIDIVISDARVTPILSFVGIY